MWQLIKKELLHILRDKGLMIFIIYAFTFDIVIASKGFNLIPENISISVHDEDKSYRSRKLIDSIEPPAFRKPAAIENLRDIDALLNDSKTVLALVIPPNFERDMYRNNASVQVLVDNYSGALGMAANAAQMAVH